jgi:hypothetical protein
VGADTHLSHLGGEVAVSEQATHQHQLYRLFGARDAPRIFTLEEALRKNVAIVLVQFWTSMALGLSLRIA